MNRTVRPGCLTTWNVDGGRSMVVWTGMGTTTVRASVRARANAYCVQHDIFNCWFAHSVSSI